MWEAEQSIISESELLEAFRDAKFVVPDNIIHWPRLQGRPEPLREEKLNDAVSAYVERGVLPAKPRKKTYDELVDAGRASATPELPPEVPEWVRNTPSLEEVCMPEIALREDLAQWQYECVNILARRQSEPLLREAAVPESEWTARVRASVSSDCHHKSATGGLI